MHDLPEPEVLACFFEDCFHPPLPAMSLRWDGDASGIAERLWHLPNGVRLQGPAPTRFGVTIHRHADDGFKVRVLWDGLCLGWDNLTRVQIMASSLSSVLAVLGTDLWYLLTQPVHAEPVFVHAKVA
jgi:hypothetical protein